MINICRGTSLGASYTEYSKHDVPHRPNGPAMEWDNGNYYWWLYGDRHRYYGPANNASHWYIHDKLIKVRSRARSE